MRTHAVSFLVIGVSVFAAGCGSKKSAGDLGNDVVDMASAKKPPASKDAGVKSDMAGTPKMDAGKPVVMDGGADLGGAGNPDLADSPAGPDGMIPSPDLGAGQDAMLAVRDLAVGAKDLAITSDLAVPRPDLATPPVQVMNNDECVNAATIDLTLPTVELMTSTTNATPEMAGPCPGASGPDVFFKFKLSQRELVYAHTFGAGWNTALFFAKSCGVQVAAPTTPDDVVCNDDACGTNESQVVALLPAGTFYLVLTGTGAGDATIHFEHAPIGSGTLTSLPPGHSTLSGKTSGFGKMLYCEASGAEASFWWLTCPNHAGGMFSASSCGGQNWDTVFVGQIPRTSTLLCNDDSCGTSSELWGKVPAGAGIQVLTLDGSAGVSNGPYTVNINRP